MKRLPFTFSHILLLLSIACFLMFLWSVWYTSPRNEMDASSHGIALVLDVSQSMNVDDMDNSISRLDAAKQALYELISRYPGIQFSLNIFAGDSLRILPFTQDISLFATFLPTLGSQNIAEQGTRIDLALEDALTNFTPDDTGYILVFTDGGEDPIEFSQRLKDALTAQDIEIFFIPVGTEIGGKIRIGTDLFGTPLYKHYNSQPVISRLNRRAIEAGAKDIGAQVLPLDDVSALSLSDMSMDTQGFSQTYIFLLLSFFCWLGFLFLSLRPIFLSPK